MKKPVITEEVLLAAANAVLNECGIEALNIRNVAKQANVSVGSVYNYFDSKETLMRALIRDFWRRVFYEDICRIDTNISFVDYVENVYAHLYEHINTFDELFMSHMELFNADHDMLSQHHAPVIQHIRDGLKHLLEQDTKVRSDAFGTVITVDALIDFVFLHVVVALRKGNKDVSFLIETLRRIVY